jgi:sugar lactone lactonase YvrE
MRLPWPLLLFLLSLVSLAACDSADPEASASVPALADAGAPDAEPEGCPAGGMGWLNIDISGTSSVDAYAVTVEGLDERITASTHRKLEAGLHRIFAEVVTSPVSHGKEPSIVREAFVPNVRTPLVCVRTDKTAFANITYQSIETDGSLFMTHANAKGQIARLSSPSTGLSKSSVDDIDVRTPSARGLAFDRSGYLWIAGADVVERVPPKNLNENGYGGTGAPDYELTGALFAAPGPAALAFDHDGDLWVSLPGAKKIVELSAADLSASGTPSPTVVIEAADFVELSALAFDANGDLYVASGDHLLRYRAARLASSTSAPADVDVTTKWKGIRDLAFDASGSLWIAYGGSDVIARLDASDLDGNGPRAVTPKIEVTLETSGVLDGIAFDEAGGLWLGHGAAMIARLSKEQLTTSATVTPAQVVEGIRLGTVSRLAFFPGPAGTPLYSSLP